MRYLFTSGLSLILCWLFACRASTAPADTAQQVYLLKWRVFEALTASDYALARARIDSLWQLSAVPTAEMHVLAYLSNHPRADEFLRSRPDSVRREVCRQLSDISVAACSERDTAAVEAVPPSLPEVQRVLVGLYLSDQAKRGNWQEALRRKYGIDSSEVYLSIGQQILTDRLRALIAAHGYPTRAAVGEDGMQAVFILTQHADHDPEWQRAQLPRIERAVRRGEVPADNYAYLYDRIQIKIDSTQRYGTQFAHVDAAAGIAELYPLRFPDSVDYFRRRYDMMPLPLYRRLMLSSAVGEE